MYLLYERLPTLQDRAAKNSFCTRLARSQPFGTNITPNLAAVLMVAQRIHFFADVNFFWNPI